MKPGAVVWMRAAAHDHRDQLWFASALGNHFVSPPGGPVQTRVRPGAEQMDRVAPIIREDHVSVAILVQIHKSKPGIFARGIDNAGGRWQSERRLLPTLLGSGPC